ncbi:TetR family transcriptional regulator [Vagococcus penaei]|uniref:TetR family transcriptional regulator n=1 Tax=Vagococcus penaei TaxID=633807 RepID=A0A1Q2D3Z7_9ENTE|nr:TetR/AcrR family transcriptional regulator [Vagococcus penaei]AQP53116.1 TetR family transcriptional regulator [Vagococcus penaei]RSU06022.1 TetR family transcriptional regulator [Vagococcus penaei]
MARRKTITREHILDATYQVIATEGFSGFTARNIASKMKSSTQPIYLEFKNMEDLREAFLRDIEKYLTDDVFSKVVTGDALLDICLNFLEFAKREKILYRSLFVENHDGGKDLNKFSHNLYYEKINNDEKYVNLSDEQKESLFIGMFIIVTGLASLISSERIHPTQEEISQIVENCVKFSESNPNMALTM